MNKFRWCVVGAGGIADRRAIPAIMKEENFALAAIMDRTPAVAERLGEKYGVKAYTDEETMLKETPCDGVYIATPVALHYPQATAALKYGCNVLVEKPLGMNRRECDRLVAAFRRENKLLDAGYMMKYHNLHIKAKNLLRGGKIGQVNTVRFFFSCWYPEIEGAWRQQRALGGGGSVMDLGAHCIELAEYLLGEEIAETKSFLANRTFSYETEDTGVFLFRMKSGVIGSAEASFNVPDGCESRLEIYGTEGCVVCRGTLGQEEKGSLSYLRAPSAGYDAMQNRFKPKAKKYYGAGGDLYLKQFRDFAARAARGKNDLLSAERAAQVQGVIDGIYAEKR